MAGGALKRSYVRRGKPRGPMSSRSMPSLREDSPTYLIPRLGIQKSLQLCCKVLLCLPQGAESSLRSWKRRSLAEHAEMSVYVRSYGHS